MGKRLLEATVPAVAIVALTLGARSVAQPVQGPSAPARNPTPANMPLATLQDMFVRFPLPPGQEVYANIDGRHMHQFVVEQANISRRYRDAGHPRFWGRIIGTSADAEDVEWLIAKFKAAGLSDVRSQPFDLVPNGFRSPGKPPSPATERPSRSSLRSRITARRGRRPKAWTWTPCTSVSAARQTSSAET